MIVTAEYLVEKEFEKIDNGISWANYRKNGFELIEIPLKKGGFVIGFEYTCNLQPKYKYPLTTDELANLYKILTNKNL